MLNDAPTYGMLMTISWMAEFNPAEGKRRRENRRVEGKKFC